MVALQGITGSDVYLVGLIPLLVGVVLFGYAQFMWLDEARARPEDVRK
jgi:hypothetical protein